MGTIHRLAGRGDPFELLQALQSGADPNDASGKDGRTPLMEAAKANNSVAVRLLLKFGATIDVADEKGRTPLMEAYDVAMKRFLLDHGANPDLGGISGMTQMAFYASFRDRAMVDFFRTYGASTSGRTRQGFTVQEALDNPEFIWMRPVPLNTPEELHKQAEFILKHSDRLSITPEQYVAANRNIIIWGLHTHDYDDPRLKKWATRVSDLLCSPELLDAAYQQHLEGDELQQALRSLERPKRRAEKERIRRERDAEFAALHLDGDAGLPPDAQSL